ncbi:MAG: hypothetical protein IPI73_10245 [Betaproteobacteria bacterium]|nr:hypothetical protein [Betaproteobacteria bacterium]
MHSQHRTERNGRTRNIILGALLSAGLLGIPAAARAQTATIYGALGNFDVVNNTGQNACGFEMELEGMTAAPAYTFSVNRFGAPITAPYTNGAISGWRVTWKSADCSTNKTVPHQPGTAFGGTCYQWNAVTYQTAGCEHFGAVANATKVTSRWLVDDPANPGSYIPHDPPMAVPMVYYYVAPAPAPAGGGVVDAPAPVIVAEVEAPEPAEAPEMYGNAQWIKVFVRQLPREVSLDELLTDNPLVVPMNPAQIETDWDVIQAEPASNSKGKRSRKQGGSTLDPTTRSVVRRYETYEYTGAYDPVTHEALCANLTCTAPAPGEIGDFISAQMSAVNVQGDFITVTKSGTGSGNVDSSDKQISCGSKCTSPYMAGTQVTLTTKADSGSTFAGWTGACAGTQSCTISVNGVRAVGAKFDAQPKGGSGGGGGGGGTTTTQVTLKVSIGSGTGTVTSNPAGINCGAACSAKYNKGAQVTLTATPPAGKQFANWTGACAGTAPTCTLKLQADATVKAQFTR